MRARDQSLDLQPGRILHKRTLALVIVLSLYPSRINADQQTFSNPEMREDMKQKNDSTHSAGKNDTEKAFSIKYQDDIGFVAFDPKGAKLFVAYPFDNGPDYPSEGLFRILEKDRIGYANLKGEIVIQPQFSAAHPFHGSRAAYCEGCALVPAGEHTSWQGGKWGFIDRNGNIVIPAQYDRIIDDFRAGYALVQKGGEQFRIDENGKMIEPGEMDPFQWLGIIGKVFQLISVIHFEDSVKIELSWDQTGKDYSFAQTGPKPLKINVFAAQNQKLLVSLFLIPWQNFSIKSRHDLVSRIGLADDLVTVSDFAVVYRSFSKTILSDAETGLLNGFEKAFKQIIQYQANQTVLDNENLDLPEEVQIISLAVFPYYIDLQVAVPGTVLPSADQWRRIVKDKMLRVSLIPDRGAITTSWYKPANLTADVYCRSVEAELLALFSNAVDASIENPDQREKIYQVSRDKLRKLFCAANSWVNVLFDIYDMRLRCWLSLPEKPGEKRQSRDLEKL